MSWHNVEKFLEQAAAHSTLIGKFWTTFFYILRFFMLTVIADKVFGDEQSNFKCNTMTPGCPNICFNDFSPISMVRLWALQLLSVALPAIIFVMFTIHKLDRIQQAKKLKAEFMKTRREKKEAIKAMREKVRQRQIALGYVVDEPAKPKPAEKKEEKKEEKEDDGKLVATKLDTDQPSILLLTYVGQVILRLSAEIFFTWLQYNTYTYKFVVPEIFKCARYPCKNVVDCFVSRPKEKTIVIWIMFSTGLLMIFLNIFELWHIGMAKIWRAWRDRHNDITKIYKVASNSDPQFRSNNRYNNTGYPQASGIPMIQYNRYGGSVDSVGSLGSGGGGVSEYGA